MSGSASLLPMPRSVFYDANGNPLAGGYVYTYVPGGTTPATTWQDAAETTPNTNPIVLDAAGSCLIYGSGDYQFTVTDSSGNAVPAYSGLSQSVMPAPGGSGDANALLQVNSSGTGFQFLTPLAATSTIEFEASGTGAETRTVSSKLQDWFSVADYSSLADAKAAASIAPLVDPAGGRLWLQQGLNPTFDQGGGTDAFAILFDTGTTITVPAGKIYNAIAWGVNGDQSFSLGASSGEAALINFNMELTTAGDTTSRLYGIIGNLDNASQGNCKAIYGRVTAQAGCTGVCVGLVGGVGTVTGMNTAVCLQLNANTNSGRAVDYGIWLGSQEAPGASAGYNYGILFDQYVSIEDAGFLMYAIGAGNFLQLMNSTGSSVLFAVDNAGVATVTGLTVNQTTGTSAAAGTYTLPSNPAGFLVVTVNGSSCRVPFYGA